MTTKPKKPNSKVLSQQKHRRRQWITFLRMCRYGVNNFSRNAWLTVAATAVMTITLFVVFVSVVSHTVLVDTVDKLRDQVSMSIYLSKDNDQASVDKVIGELKKLDSVMAVTTITPDEARSKFIDENKTSKDTIGALSEATNEFPWTLRIKLQNINDTNELSEAVSNNKVVKAAIDPERPPSFAGDRRLTIERIGRAAQFAQSIGIIASTVFVVISMMIIFNTIRMAIFNRREEIQMMKLIGAERSFIRGPFLVEAIVYGFIAAFIATGLGYGILVLASPALLSYGINIQPALNILTNYWGLVIISMVVLGAVIGIISSSLATRRYLRL